MKVYIMTDLEGVAGVLDFENWCTPQSRFYEMGREFLTGEVNAAVEGFSRSGAREVVVADGHGYGAMNPKLLDSRAQLSRGGRSSEMLREGFDAVASVGQHARSRSEFAHIAHTQDFSWFELTINGLPIGEFGQLVMIASQLGVRTIFGSGDEAFAEEARELLPGIETVAVKRGTTPGRGDECNADAYARRNLGAIHYQPERARQLICAGAERAIRRAKAEKGFGIFPLRPPFEQVTIMRAKGDQPRRISRVSHPTDVIALMNTPCEFKALNEN